MSNADAVDEMKHRAEQQGVDPRQRKRFIVVCILLALSLIAMVSAGIWAWNVQRNKAVTLAQQIKLACDTGEFGEGFSREDEEALCKNAEKVIESNDPELQDEEIQEREIQEQEIQEPEIQEPEDQNRESQDPESQDAETQDAEDQEAEEQEPEIQDPENQDPEIDDPDPNDPDPAEPGTWGCPEGQYVSAITRNSDGSLGVVCRDLPGGGPPVEPVN